MLVGIFNHYNNNSYGMGKHKEPAKACFLGARGVISAKGIAILELDREYSIKEKLEIAKEIDKNLKDKLNLKISFAMCAESDCYKEVEMPEYYAGAKEINPDIKSIFVGSRKYNSKTHEFDGEWEIRTGGAKIDIPICRFRNIEDQLVEALNSEETDTPKTDKEWYELTDTLRDIADKSIDDVRERLNISHGF